MQYKKIADESGLATYAIIMDEGDEAFAELHRFAFETGVNGASLTGVGGGSNGVLGWFDFDTRSYLRNAFDEQVEVVSLLGDIATTEDERPQVHARVFVAKRDAYQPLRAPRPRIQRRGVLGLQPAMIAGRAQLAQARPRTRSVYGSVIGRTISLADIDARHRITSGRPRRSIVRAVRTYKALYTNSSAHR